MRLITENEIHTIEPEAMNIGTLNMVVKALREALYQNRLYTQKLKEQKLDNQENYENLNNQELLATVKKIHGVLYHRLNRIQRDLNIANEEVKRLKEKIKHSPIPSNRTLYKLVPIDPIESE